MRRTTAAIGSFCGLLLLFSIGFSISYAAHSYDWIVDSLRTRIDSRRATNPSVEQEAITANTNTLQHLLNNTRMSLADAQSRALEDKAQIAALKKKLQDALNAEHWIRALPQTSIDYQSLWSAAHCTNPAVAQSLTPEQIANTTRIEDMLGPPGVLVPYEVLIKEKGRGLYATRPISKGSLVIQCNREVMFDSKDEFDAFVACIPDVKLKSDVVRWAWVSSNDTPVRLSLDDGSLVNHCTKPTIGSHWSDEVASALPEIDQDRLVIPSDSNSYALRDIKQGEEICDNYDEYGAKTKTNTKTKTHWFNQLAPLDGISR